ncbi:MAG: DUF1446 domain-containing protein [Acidobacteria bacterium]|nr:DUF1446 domain-containing protein [Acidobacteriota bacterium]
MTRPGRKRTVRVGNAGGYWGDDPRALRSQVLGPEPPEFVTADFLAEITMSILQKQRARDPGAGFARDFVSQIAPLLGAIRERGITVITNAGGVNPTACAQAVLGAAKEAGVELTVAVVEGDDLLERLDDLTAAGVRLDNLETGDPFAPRRADVLSANAYFGAEPIVRALVHRPDVVVTGRVTDTGITLAPIRHAFGWDPHDWDRIAGGIVAGHLIECGVQATGGNFTDWERVPGLGNEGFPVVEVEDDGAFALTKQSGSGGLVSPAVAREQLLYEMGDPERYLCPDATVDFSGLTVAAAGDDRVLVRGARGGPPPPDLKVSASVRGGFSARGSLVVGGPDVRAKTAALDAAFRERLRADCEAAGVPFPAEFRVDLAGADAAQRGLADASPLDPSEGLVRFAAWSPSREPLNVFRKLLPSFILSGPAGLAVTGGAPAISEVVGYWPALVPRGLVSAAVRVIRTSAAGSEAVVAEEDVRFEGPTAPADTSPPSAGRRATPDLPASPPLIETPLGAVAHARSGDKGDAANIGIIGRSADCYGWLREHLTTGLVGGWVRDVAEGPVVRYEVPGLWALNFILERALGGGGTRSLLLDPQGKTLAQGLLRQRVRIPAALLATIPPENRPLSPVFAAPFSTT